MERTFVMVKPDGVQKKLVGEIIKRCENAGLKIVAMKFVQADEKLLPKHYPDSMARSVAEKAKKAFESEGKKFNYNLEEYGCTVLKNLKKYITETPVVAMVLEGDNAVSNMRKIAGYTDPSRAEKGTIRGDFSTDSYEKANAEKRSVRNLVHASGTPEEAQKEIKLWFKKGEILEY